MVCFLCYQSDNLKNACLAVYDISDCLHTQDFLFTTPNKHIQKASANVKLHV